MLDKPTFYTLLNNQLNASLKTSFEDLFINLSHLNTLPVFLLDEQGNKIYVRQDAIDAAKVNAKAWADALAPNLAEAVSDQVDTYIKTATVEVTVLNAAVSIQPVPPVLPLLGSVGHIGIPGSVETPGGLS